ncbi:MAG: hypothetical protein Q607_CBUC00062G0016 [Clostridium butyricum DORA_1]|nr:MAG: hypothetical protein Q607_CBUC00062G0016 [Clostridium butyricum DORA_1]
MTNLNTSNVTVNRYTTQYLFPYTKYLNTSNVTVNLIQFNNGCLLLLIFKYI